ncbi:nitroreductase [Ferrovibrio sp.]|uniref:nitroreductase n=1 Tax=Ferrovibrio sp. TaxID=1917215 RepID=UPI003D0E16DA
MEKAIVSPDASDPEGAAVMFVERAIQTRRAVRQFLPTPIPIETVRRIIQVASRAPSGNNAQPWQVRVLTGASKQKLVDAILGDLFTTQLERPAVAEFNPYPTEWKSPFNERRKEVGVGMYTLLGIAKGDKKAMREQGVRNFKFFDAPVGMIFTLDRAFVPASAVDLGMFLGNITTLARAHGIDTCPQAAFAVQHAIVRQTLKVPENEVIMCGMALGYADHTAPIDKLVTSRMPLEEYVIEMN